jgi:phosphoglycolate phosphatase
MTPPMNAPSAILFDLDGTLVDSLEDIADAMNHALGELGHPPHALEAYRTLVGDGARELARRALPPEHTRDIEPVLARYKDRYHRHPITKSRAYPGIYELLTTLRERAIPLAVVTNKPHEAAVAIVDALFPSHTFRVVLGQRDGVPHKPDPAMPRAVLRELDLASSDAWFVGDTSTDMCTARNAGLVAIGVTWGFRARAELEAHGAHAIIDVPAALLEIDPARVRGL